MAARFIPGAGRLVATTNCIAFFTAPHESLVRLVGGHLFDPTATATDQPVADLFKEVAAFVAASDDSFEPFVLVTKESPTKLLLFGDMAVRVNGTTLTPSAQFPWLGHTVEEGEAVSVSVGSINLDGESDILNVVESGCVPAASFSWTSGAPEVLAPVAVAPAMAAEASVNGDGHEILGLIPSPDALESPELQAPLPTPDPGSDLGADPARYYGRLRFDDGQEHEVTGGLYVGRHPTKMGLPDGYGTVVVTGQHVSRVHWKLVVGHRIEVVDLGSTTGTTVVLPATGIQYSVGAEDQPMEIVPGTKINFGDRWAVFEA